MSEDTISKLLKDLVARLDFSVIAGPLTTKIDDRVENAGVSGVVLLYESHAAIHTYAVARSAFVDVFGCRTFDAEVVKRVLHDHLGSFDVSEETVSDRGLEWSKHVQSELARWTKSRD